jgi:DNA (cytosine-5)-methyltransferase 1
MKKKATFDFIDLCAGIGGLRIPFDAKKNNNPLLQGTCVFSSEIDANARKVYAEYFEDDESHIDRDFTLLTNLTKKTEAGSSAGFGVPVHDLLLAGFPCQPFSHAGLKNGFEDTRGTLFFSIATIIAKRKPKVILLENVRGLVSHDEGRTLGRILEILKDPEKGTKTKDRVKYFVPQPKLLNARDFGLPQNRVRLFIVAIREDVAKESLFEWPEATHDKNSLVVGKELQKRVDDSFTISTRLWQGHIARKDRNLKAGKGFGYQLFSPRDKYVATISARYYKDGSEALISQPGRNPRKLTPEEVRNLQGFPKDFRLGASKIQSYRQLGNAVPVPVVAAIAAKLQKYLT